MEISNETGLYKCFACGIGGNLQRFFKDYIANSSQDANEGSFTSWAIDYLHLDRFINIDNNPENAKTKLEMKTLYEKLNHEHVKETGVPYVMPQDVKEQVKKEMFLDVKMNDEYVDTLLANSELMKDL